MSESYLSPSKETRERRKRWSERLKEGKREAMTPKDWRRMRRLCAPVRRERGGRKERQDGGARFLLASRPSGPDTFRRKRSNPEPWGYLDTARIIPSARLLADVFGLEHDWRLAEPTAPSAAEIQNEYHQPYKLKRTPPRTLWND